MHVQNHAFCLLESSRQLVGHVVGQPPHQEQAGNEDEGEYRRLFQATIRTALSGRQSKVRHGNFSGSQKA